MGPRFRGDDQSRRGARSFLIHQPLFRDPVCHQPRNVVRVAAVTTSKTMLSAFCLS